jgi:acetyl-CoA carboxylase biotin carboxyl carrier protein
VAGATVSSPINDDPGAPNVDPLSPQDAAELISLLDQLPVDELELETERFTLSLRRAGSGWVRRTTVGPSTPDGVVPVAVAAVEIPAGLVAVRSPLPGTFYRSPRPGAPPFVGDGDGVGPDTVIGLVETMKLFTSIAAGAKGTVVEFCVPDATPVEQDAVVALVKM